MVPFSERAVHKFEQLYKELSICHSSRKNIHISFFFFSFLIWAWFLWLFKCHDFVSLSCVLHFCKSDTWLTAQTVLVCTHACVKLATATRGFFLIHGDKRGRCEECWMFWRWNFGSNCLLVAFASRTKKSWFPSDVLSFWYFDLSCSDISVPVSNLLIIYKLLTMWFTIDLLYMSSICVGRMM